MGSEGFWNRQSDASRAVIDELKRVKGVVDPCRALEKSLTDQAELAALADPEADRSTLEEVDRELARLAHAVDRYELLVLFNGPNDHRDVFFSIHAGAGGTDAADWAAMLDRMYGKWLDRSGYDVSLIDKLDGEEAGIRRVIYQVRGKYPFGYLKSEIGVHRLVRISPFDANQRRHTAFASVDVTPEFEDVPIEILDKDLRVDTYRAGGKGGQHVNVTDSAVRITHVPSGIVAQCQNERSQIANRKTAMKMLASKMHQHEQSKRDAELAKLYGEKGEIAWGSQIRSYVLDPYQMVKDHRTGHETGKISFVLDGDLDGFIEAFLRWKDRKY